MTNGRTTVTLESEDLRSLEQLAQREGRAVEELVAFAVRDYIARHTRDRAEWRRRWDEVIARIQSGVPDGVTPGEIEAEARAARAEVRAERRRARHG